jgi:hypothetical protein
MKGKQKFPPYVGSKAKSKVKPAFSTSTRSNRVGLLRLQQMDGGAQIYDSAGSKADTKAGMRFVSNLDKPFTTKSAKGKTRSRVMFPQTEKNMGMVQESIAQSIEKLNKVVQDNIQRAA